MDAQTILGELKSQEAGLRQELIEMEKTFNVKKEQYLKLQGAIEALNLVDKEDDDDEDDGDDD